jgi:phosphonate transport system ATP-binding protein
VEMALANFPRIIGLREGALMFDLPTAEVTEQHLQTLYAQHLHELTGAANSSPDAVLKEPAPVAMHCR